MNWPSQNVPKGGILESKKVHYSAETKEFLKSLIAESRMSTMQRNKINYSLRNGEPLPAIKNIREAQRQQEEEEKRRERRRPGSSKRRSLNTILESGAYQRDRFHPQRPQIDRETMKEQLQERMSRNEKVKLLVKSQQMKESKKEEKEEPLMTRYEQIKKEIEEREEWLKEMEEIGAGADHRLIIQQQIHEKLREMAKLKPSHSIV